MMTNFNSPIISEYSPISAKGGRRTRRNKSKIHRSKRHKKTRSRRTRSRRYH